MDGSFIPTAVQELWNVWNIRGFVILSLFLQLLLAFMARLRKKSNNRLIIFVIWSAYFMADWAATFTFGLISNARCNDSANPPEVNENLLAFWAAFLLIHLGGPDTITAFSLEDNALWTRHLVGLVAQVLTFLYIFLKTLPNNNLVAPTILVAVAGAIKYGERTRALYLASMENLKKSMVKPSHTSLDRSKGDALREAFHFFQIFKGLVVDIMPTHAERSQSQKFILSKRAKEAFDLMVWELDFLYELFYTKIMAVNSAWGLLARTITYYNVVTALVLYCFSSKDAFHDADIWINFFLMVGVVALETLNGIMLVVSDWDFRTSWYNIMWYIAQGLCISIPLMVFLLSLSLYEWFVGYSKTIRKSWCQNLGAFNLLSHCFVQCRQGDNKLKKFSRAISRFVPGITDGSILRNAFGKEIQNFIFDELKGKALFANDDEDNVKTVFESRGSWTLSNSGNNVEIMHYVDRFDYDRSLLAWHVATEICYNTDGAVDATESNHKELAKILSDYMNYLLIKKPNIMSAVAGIGHIRYRDTFDEITFFCREFKSKDMNEFCTKVVDELMRIEPDHEYSKTGTSVLSDACNLANELKQKDKKWEIISRVWAEVLMYAAGHCRPEKHAQALIEGGELVTIIWLLMAHFGIGPHFPYSED